MKNIFLITLLVFATLFTYIEASAGYVKKGVKETKKGVGTGVDGTKKGVGYGISGTKKGIRTSVDGTKKFFKKVF